MLSQNKKIIIMVFVLVLVILGGYFLYQKRQNNKLRQEGLRQREIILHDLMNLPYEAELPSGASKTIKNSLLNLETTKDQNVSLEENDRKEVLDVLLSAPTNIPND